MLLALAPSMCGIALQVPKTLPLNNGRCCGGLPTADGRVVADGLLLRSATPADASIEDVEHLRTCLSLRTVIDLRTPEEAMRDCGLRLLYEEGPGAAPAVHYVPIVVETQLRAGIKRKALTRPRYLLPMALHGLSSKVSPLPQLRARAKHSLEIAAIGLLDSSTLDEIYLWLLMGYGEEIRRVIETVSTPGSLPCLLHCTHGKDRTGLAVAMCLHVCGVPVAHIARDYALSGDYGCTVEGRAAMEQMLPPHLVGRVNIDRWCEAPEEVLPRLFDHVERRWGSINAYLDSIGVDAALRARCRDALTVPADETHCAYAA